MALVLGASFEIVMTIDISGRVVIDNVNVGISKVDVVGLYVDVHDLTVNGASIGVDDDIGGTKARTPALPHCLNSP